MESDKKTEPTPEKEAEKATPKPEQQAPADALSRTPEELEAEEAKKEAESGDIPDDEPEKKLSPLKRLFRKVNVYFLIFILLVVVVGAIAIVNYINSQNTPPPPDIATQDLTEDALKELANTDASVGSTSQTLTIQGNAIIAGQTLMRGDLNVAGDFQTGGSIQGPTLTISSTSNLGQTQIDSLQVANSTTIQGLTSLRDLTVSGSSSFSGAITASQLTVTKLIMSGNGSLEIPNHIGFTGASPTRTISGSNAATIGSGGSVSVNGSDAAGTININTGSGTAAGCFTRINFNQAYTTQPRVIISPVGYAAGQTQFYVERNTTGFNLCTVNAPPTNQSFAFDYFVMN